MAKQTKINDIQYLNEVLAGAYLVNEDWLVNRAYKGLVSGELTLEDFLFEAIRDIFYEVESDTYGTIDDEIREEFLNDGRVKKIAKKYNIDLS